MFFFSAHFTGALNCLGMLTDLFIDLQVKSPYKPHVGTDLVSSIFRF